MKNLYGKAIKVDPRETLAERAYAVYGEDPRLPGWTWYVLKVNQGADSKKGKFASAFCLVTSPMAGSYGDLGDTYLSSIGGRLLKGDDVRGAHAGQPNPLDALLGDA